MKLSILTICAFLVKNAHQWSLAKQEIYKFKSGLKVLKQSDGKKDGV